MRAIHPAADAAIAPIGARLRSVRAAQGMTLAQVAETTGLSKGFISRVERDETSPSLATLVQLCQVLSLPIGALFEEPEVHHVSFDAAPRVNLGGSHVDERLMTPRGEERLQLVRSELAADAHGGSDLYTINAEVEVLHVLAGSLRLTFIDRSVLAHTGDAVTLPGREPHTWCVEGGEPATVLWVMAPAPWSGSA